MVRISFEIFGLIVYTLCDCDLFVPFLDVVSTRRADTLRVSIPDIFEDSNKPIIEEVPLVIPHPEIRITVPQQATEQDPPETIGPMDVNPFGLTNDEIDELLQGLESVPDMFQDLDEPMIGEVPWVTVPQQATVLDLMDLGATERVPPKTVGPMNVDPMAEIDQILRGLEGSKESCVSEGHAADAELNAVLDMCVEDYIV